MRELKELALMINLGELKTTTNNLLAFQSDSKLAMLYSGIVDGLYDTDQTAMNNLYPTNASSSGYRKLKSTLKKRLKDAILLFDERKQPFTDYQKAYYQCHKDWVVVKILLGKNAREAAVDIALSLLRKAQKYEFTDLVMDMASVLRLHYGARMGDSEKFKEYHKILQKYQDQFIKEENAQHAYIELILYYVNNRSPKEEQHEQARIAAKKIKPAFEKYGGRQIELYYYLVKLMEYTTVYQYDKALDVCEKAIHCFENKPYSAPVPLQIFYYQQLVCYIQLCQFDKGQEVVEKCFALVNDGSFNYFKFHELYFLLTMHAGNYSEAVLTFEKATNHQRFQFLPAGVREVWRIYHAYLYYLHIVGQIPEMPQLGASSKNFKLSRFINELPIFSKDKSGFNASVLIIQTLILIAEKRYEDTISRFDSTKQYCYRYLKSEYTRRSYLFVKMLLKVQQIGFDKPQIEQKTKKLLKELKSIPIEVSQQAIEIEIIPFELLWQYLLNSLD